MAAQVKWRVGVRFRTMNQRFEGNTKVRFNLRFVFAAVTLLGLILAIPVIGVLLFSGMIGVIVFLGLLERIEIVLHTVS